MNDEHIPAPADHAPRKETLTDGIEGIVIRETGNDDAWIGSNDPVEAKQ